MRGINKWSYSPYRPFFVEVGDIYINRVCPYEDSFHIEWNALEGENAQGYTVYYRKRDCGDFINAGSTDETEFDVCELVEDYEYEVYVQVGEKKSRTRLLRTGKAVGTIVNYVHPEDKVYSFSGYYLCSPSLVRHSDGYLLASMDLYAGRYPKNLTLIYRSDDEGKTWHYVSELYPCFHGKMFMHKGELYMLAESKELGDLLIGKSLDGGKTFGMPTIILRGSNCDREPGVHKNPQNIVHYKGRIYETLEWGCGDAGYFAPMVMSCDENEDLLNAENWRLSEPIKYDRTWENLPDGLSSGNIEGTLTIFPDGNLYNVMRYDMSRLTPDRGLILAYRVNDSDPDAPLETPPHPIKFPANSAKFMIKKDDVTNRYYTIACRVTDEMKFWQRNLLSLMVSDDMEKWDVVCDLYDFRDKDPWYTGMQYVDFIIEGDDIIYLSRTAMNKPHNYHDSNYSTFHRIKNFREI